jgi:hypothetical protein
MKIPTPIIALFMAPWLVLADAGASSNPPITVVSYYFGNYHPGDPRNVKVKGPD